MQEVAWATNCVVRIRDLTDRWTRVEVVVLVARGTAARALWLAAAAAVGLAATAAMSKRTATLTAAVGTSAVVIVGAARTAVAAVATFVAAGRVAATEERFGVVELAGHLARDGEVVQCLGQVGMIAAEAGFL